MRATSSGLKSADASIMSGPGRLAGLTVIGGSAATVITVYDNASAASGTVLEKISIPASGSLSVDYSFAVDVNNGIYVTVSGTGAACIVRFVKG